jgi:hypothetical protein
MGRACSTDGGRGTLIGYWWESQKERDHSEDLDVGGKLILKCIFEDGVVLAGVFWLWIGTSGRLL